MIGRARARVARLLRRRTAEEDLPGELLLRAQLTRKHEIDVLLDVGANEGLFALRLRACGFDGRIVSFEPLTRMFEKLEVASAGDPAWECMRLALGARPGKATLNIASNWASSSLFSMASRHSEAEPRSVYVDTEECTVATLDELGPTVLRPGERAYLKLDVQGSELDVLRGSERALAQVHLLEAELSLVPLYEGAPSFDEVVGHLDERGFGLVALDPAFVEPSTGAILQLNGIFTRLQS